MAAQARGKALFLGGGERPVRARDADVVAQPMHVLQAQIQVRTWSSGLLHSRFQKVQETGDGERGSGRSASEKGGNPAFLKPRQETQSPGTAPRRITGRGREW